MFTADYLVYIFLSAGVVFSIISRKLTIPGALTAGMVGLLVFCGGSYAALSMLTLFFVAGTVATRIGKHKKEAINAAESRHGQRTAGQVLANGGVAAILGVAALLWPNNSALFQLILAGSLAAAMADTLSSELGMLYGRRFFNIITLKPDQRGRDGVVSLEGTLIGVAGAAAIAAAYGLTFGWSLNGLWIVAAGVSGNLVDSVLGATVERSRIIGNNLVNFFNTLTGALICWLLHYL